MRVMVLGTGAMGCSIARLVLDRPGLELVAVYARRPEREGLEIGPLLGRTLEHEIRVDGDINGALQRTTPDVAIQATCSTLADARAEIYALIGRRVNVISIAEEMAYPAARDPAAAAALGTLAVGRGVAVLGTGVNPGFVLDLLVITLSGVCADIRAISARRVNDLAPYGRTVLASQGVGLTREAFAAAVADGRVVGHVGFAQSIHMIAAALGWDIERIDEERAPIVSAVRRKTAMVTVEPGQVAGCLHRAIGYRDGVPAITLDHPQQIHPHLEGVATGDAIEIAGTPDLHVRIAPEIPGGEATRALAVNMIPRVLDAAPGLYCMADLPPPAATLADARRFITSERGLRHHG